MSYISQAESLGAVLSETETLEGVLKSPGTIEGNLSSTSTSPYVELPALTNPATAAEIVLGYQAIDKNSYRLTGTLDLEALKEESYSEGYETGKADGYSEGYEVGKSDGYSEGYEAGKADGYSEGYTDGVASVDTQSYYDSGYAAAEEAAAEALAALTEVE